ncbi:hypothetical protein MKEN_00585200 [Mycena kentingensis (nom. inval.)]|nr:hypothetical protein MKEN_00585200 [Mycena kentingensis (nom. inval.)]
MTDLEANPTAGDDSVRPRWHLDLHPDVRLHPHPQAKRGLGSGFLHPTHAVLALSGHPAAAADEKPDGNEKPKRELEWTSRDHRKHRHLVEDPRTGRTRPAHQDAKKASQGVLGRIGNMRRVEYWNVSWWVAVLFTLGSIVWVVNGFYAFLPYLLPARFSVDANMEGTGWTAWLGATIFEFGALAGLWEAWNRGDVADFGWNVGRLARVHRESESESPNSTPNLKTEASPQKPKHEWIWFSTSGKYFHELGFLAAFVQYWAATIFWISGFTAIPTIQNAISSNQGLLDGVFWTPQVIGGTGFIIASALMMLETQKRWYLPAPASLGWHVGFWNLVGGVGFMLCGAFGYALEESTGIAYQSSCSTFWGGWAFLIGSCIQWYECVNPVKPSV